MLEVSCNSFLQPERTQGTVKGSGRGKLINWKPKALNNTFLKIWKKGDLGRGTAREWSWFFMCCRKG